MERRQVVADTAAEVLGSYEQRGAGRIFEDGGNAAAVLEDLAWQRFELEVVDVAYLGEGVMGELNLDAGKISVRNDLDAGRRAFTIAHEIGHAALKHTPRIGRTERRIQDLDGHVDERVGAHELEAQDGVYRAYNARDLVEVEANLFAAEMLVPTELVLASVREEPGWTVEGLAERFGVSQEAMLTQLANALLLRHAGAVEAEGAEAEALTGGEVPAVPRLDGMQGDAVASGTPALVIAGPGAGKTRILAERYAYLVRSGVAPESILALTFSNKAAEEMRTRIAAMLGGGAESIQASTFHAFCLETLQGYGYLLNLPQDFGLATEMDASLIVRRKLCELDLSHLEELSDPGLYVPAVLDAISRAKDELRTPEDFLELTKAWAGSAESDEEREAVGKALEAAKIYAAYEGWLAEGGRVDYGDLIRHVIRLLELPGIGEEIRGRYEHVLVDEFQDINYASGRLLKALDGGRGIVWAVADPDQSIYRFRGASAANLDRFGEDHPGFNLVRLDWNYRSGPDIVGTCHGLRGIVESAGEESSAPPTLKAAREAPEAPAVSLVVAPDREAELDYLVREIRRREGLGVALGDQAVLCTSNAQARRVVDRLVAAGLAAEGPTSLLGGGEIKDTLAVLGLLRGGPEAGAALVRVAGFSDNPLTETDALLLVGWARERKLPVEEALARSREIEELSDEAAGYLADLGRLIGELPRWTDAWRAVLAYAFHPESRLRTLFRGDSGGADRRLSQVGQLAVLARSFSDREDLVEGTGLGGFIEYVRELAASNKGNGALYSPPAGDAVRVMTVHKSKGLEFPVVYVPHLAKNHFPVRGGGPQIPLPPGFLNADETGGREEEDRCLLYVALTRAEDELVLSRAEVYGARAAKALPLIDRLVREKDGRVMFAEVPWEPEQDAMPIPASASELAALPVRNGKTAYRFWQLQSYDRCPLQAGYSLLSGLPEKRSAYQDFRDSVYRVMGDMRLAALESGENPDPGWAKERLAEVWEEEGPTGHFYEPAYRRRADQMVEVWRASGAPLKWNVREGLSLTLADGARLEVTADAIIREPDGKIVVAQHKFGGPRKSHKERDHVNRHALYLAAVHETWPGVPAKVVLHYLSRGETVDATPSDRVVSGRISKLKGYAEKIGEGSFRPKPGQECKSCNWNLVCPSSA